MADAHSSNASDEKLSGIALSTKRAEDSGTGLRNETKTTASSIMWFTIYATCLLAVVLMGYGVSGWWYSDSSPSIASRTTTTTSHGFVKVVKVNGEKIISIPPRHCVDVSEPFRILPTSKSHSNSGKARIIGHGEAEVYFYAKGHPLHSDCVNDAEKLDRKKPTVDVDWEEAHHEEHDWEE